MASRRSPARARRVRALYRGTLRRTKYRRAQTDTILRLERAGMPRDAIAQVPGIPGGSLDYVAALQHLDEE